MATQANFSEMDDRVRHLRARVSAGVRFNRPDDQIAGLRQELTATKMERAIRQGLAAAPPITAEQRAALAEILRGA